MSVMDVVLADDHLLTHILQHDVQREQVLAKLNVKQRVIDSVHVQISKRAIETVDEQIRRVSIGHALKAMYGIDTLEAWMDERMMWRIELMMEAKVVCKHWRDVCRIALTDPVWFSAWTRTSFLPRVPRRVVKTEHFLEDGLYRDTLPMEFTFDAEVNLGTEDFSEDGFPESDCSGFFEGIHAGYENPISTYCNEVKPGNPYRCVRGTLHNLQVNWDLEKNELSLSSIEFTFEGKVYNSIMDLLRHYDLLDLFGNDDDDDDHTVSFLKNMKLGVEMQGGYWLDVSCLNLHDSFVQNELWQNGYPHNPDYCFLHNPDGSPCRCYVNDIKVAEGDVN